MITANQLIIGNLYNVHSQRKGSFQIKITSVSGEWIITKGKAKAMCHYNERHKGEEIIIRDCLSTFIEVN